MSDVSRQNRSHGLTLIEILIVVAIIGMLVAVTVVTFGGTSGASRDAKRQADLRQLQLAVEAYKNETGRYPEGCNGPDQWAGQLGTNYQCNNNTGIYAAVRNTGQYIIDLAPKYIPVLPIDPKRNGDNSGYVYRTNSAGTVYKLMAMSTVESETVSWNHEFASCQFFDNPDTNVSSDIRVVGWCAKVHFAGGNTPEHCSPTNARFQTSYGVWGGFAPYALSVTVDTALNSSQRNQTVQNTTNVICQ